MHDTGKRLGGLILALWCSSALPALGAEKVKQLGIGPAYDQIGKVAVMHSGRIKPFDTVAREEVKQVYSRETIKLHDPAEEIDKLLGNEPAAPSSSAAKPVESWGPVGAFLGWTVYPELWDDKSFILVDYLPLRKRIVADALTARLKAIADKSTTPAAEKAELEKFAAMPSVDSTALGKFLRDTRLSMDDRRSLAELAVKLTEEHKWLSPRELDDAKIIDDGHSHTFLEWAAELDEQQRQFTANPQSAARLTEVEKRAIEVARRLATYKAYSGERLQSADLILIMPRPSNAQYLTATAQAIKEARANPNMRDLPLMKLDSLKAISTYWNFVPRDDRRDPTEDAKFDERYAGWLRDNSVWVPLKAILKSKPEELVATGYPEAETKAFVDAYHELENAETSSPGQISDQVADRFLKSARALGESVNPSKYPTVAMVERETHFNAVNPFWQAPYAYFAALTLLAISLGMTSTTGPKRFPGLFGSTIYRLGMTALAIGIGLEIYGFYLRVRITGWAPVTNMYETVVWVALVAAVLSVVLELIFRPVYFALAGSAVALLGTITAANVPLLDPSIKSLQPVLRSNLWLTIHVLTEVSSYAAFGLAWALGLIATMFYLTATYKRSPRFTELALLLVPGLPLLFVGGLGVAASYGLLGPQWSLASDSQPNSGDGWFYLFGAMGLAGLWLTLAGLIALASEGVSRLIFRRAQEHGLADDLPEYPVKLDARGLAMQKTAAVVKPLSNFVYRTMQVGVLLIAAGTILGGVWADYSWGRFWGWDPKEVWALITLLVYLVPLHGRFAGWINNFGLVIMSVVCFGSVVMAWYGVNFVLGVGLHSYGFTEGGSQGIMSVIITSVLSLPLAAVWRRSLAQRPDRPATFVVNAVGSLDTASARNRTGLAPTSAS